MSETIDAAVAERLTTLCAELGADELRVLVLIGERLRVGRRCYGALHVESDQRDFGREALEEAADGLVYVACSLMQDRR